MYVKQLKNVTVTNTHKGKTANLPFVLLKDAALGSDYNLSVVFVSEDKIKQLNTMYRGKNKATDILSFSLSESEGEIFICLKQVNKKALLSAEKVSQYLQKLFIHGLAHLNGFDHGSKMESKERTIASVLVGSKRS